MRLMVLRLSPERRAIERVLQCVASAGVVSNVSVTTLSTSASVILRGAPDRGSSTRPSKRRSKNRDRHFPTVGFDRFNSAATSVFVLPSAHLRTIRARCANAWAVFGRRTHCSNVSFSSSERLNGGIGRPRRISILLVLKGTTAPLTCATNFRDRTLVNGSLLMKSTKYEGRNCAYRCPLDL